VIAIVIAVVLAAAAVVVVALPFLREPVAEDDRLDTPDDAHLALVEDRDRALAALKEVEFDHRTGKIDDEDYRELVGPLRRAAARALRALDHEPRYGAPVNLETPNLPTEPAPPPDEATPPTPAPVPEPYPPPDEVTVPSLPQE